MVYLSRSNFLQTDFKALIQKWRDGWSPNWEALMIEFNEDINIDRCVEGEFIQLPTKDWKNKKAVYRNSPIQLNRFVGSHKPSWGRLTRTGYHILRSDGTIASIGIEKKRIGWFHIQSNDNNSQIRMTLHFRAFENN